MVNIILRDGTHVKDPRLGRMVEFDEQSKQYPIREFVKGQPRRSYTWRCAQRMDQLNTPRCVGFAYAHELIARPKEYKLIVEADAYYIYKEAQKVDYWAGEGYDGTSVLAGAKILKRDGYIDEYRWAFGVDDLALAVSRFGPAVIGINWYDSMFYPDDHGFISPAGSPAGGHAILVRGYNDARKEFLLRNSWGPNWGVDGDCILRYADMDRLLNENGEAVIIVKRNFERDVNA